MSLILAPSHLYQPGDDRQARSFPSPLFLGGNDSATFFLEWNAVFERVTTYSAHQDSKILPGEHRHE